VGLCATRSGHAAGLPDIPNDQLKMQSDLFARRLLMPPELLPAGWRLMSALALAIMCGVPEPVAEAQLQAAASLEI